MNLDGIITAAICFLCIGLFHPIVIKAEYHWSAHCWPLFLAAGLAFLTGSMLVESTLFSTTLGILGCSSLWSILELRQQEQRVAKGWFPSNPKRMSRK
ncbi:MAG: DUF4491 family protein [Clostridium sp.]|nr:DUF4491 family protein [Clostridium sp.]